MLDVETASPEELKALPAVKKTPRKPRPSEIAAKAAAKKVAVKPAKKSAKKAPAGKSKPKAKKPVLPRKRPKPKKAVKGKTKAPARKLVRTARLDLRCTPAERSNALGVAKRLGMTVTDVVMHVLKHGKMPRPAKKAKSK